MKEVKYTYLFVLMLALFASLDANSQRSDNLEQEIIRTNIGGEGPKIVLTVTAGKEHNHPMMAAWIEDAAGNYLQTLYVNQSVAKADYAFAKEDQGEWQNGEAIRPASLPVWSHHRGVKASEGHYMPTPQNPVPDAYTSATPSGNFVLYSRAETQIVGKVKVFFEVNQSWDWNDFWTNGKYPDDENYMTSSQPSLVYAAVIDFENPDKTYHLKAIGHGHYAGQDGKINPDLNTLTTAMDIFVDVKVEVE